MIEHNSDGSLGVVGCRGCRLRFFTKKTYADDYSDLAEEIDFVATYPIANPDETGRGSRNQFWWICKNNKQHKYHMTPEKRIYCKKRHKEPCPYCKGLRQPKAHFI